LVLLITTDRADSIGDEIAESLSRGLSTNPCRFTWMRAGALVVVNIRGQDVTQMALVEDQDVVETLAV
jgi:hypothetical protein